MLFALVLSITAVAQEVAATPVNYKTMIVRLAEIEVYPEYKQGTLHMVKSLKLPTMNPLDPETMKLIFNKQSTETPQ